MTSCWHDTQLKNSLTDNIKTLKICIMANFDILNSEFLPDFISTFETSHLPNFLNNGDSIIICPVYEVQNIAMDMSFNSWTYKTILIDIRIQNIITCYCYNWDICKKCWFHSKNIYFPLHCTALYDKININVFERDDFKSQCMKLFGLK